MKNSSLYVRRITISTIFLSISLVLKTAFSFHIPLFGQNGMSIGISGIFSMVPSFLFGPVYGAIVSGLSDFMGYLLKPTGAYLPQMTLIVAAGGFIRGALWFAIRKRSSRNMRITVIIISILFLAFGICNIMFLNADGINNHFYEIIDINDVNTDDMHFISKMLVDRTIGTKDPAGNLATYIVSVTAGLLGIAVLCLILLLADFFISKRFFKDIHKGQVMQLLIAMVISGLIVTTLNTILLRETIYVSWKLLPFVVVWMPRAIEEILGNTVKAYFVAILLGVFQNQKNLRRLIK